MTSLNNWLASLMSTATPSLDECCRYLQAHIPQLTALAATEQDPQWHGEGNVAIHTQMVLEALYQRLAQRRAPLLPEQRQALILGALLHDIAKPETTTRKWINGEERIVSPKHEELGRDQLAPILSQLGLAYPVIRQVMGLVGFHQYPKQLVIKNAGYKDYLKLARNVDLELLYELEQADMRGRICSDFNQQIDMLDEFQLFAQEYQLWEASVSTRSLIASWQLDKLGANSSPYAFTYIANYALSELTQGIICHPSQILGRTWMHCTNYSQLYIMCGISGSGKSTWIAKHCPQWEIISLDDIRQEINGNRRNQKNSGKVVHLARQRLKQALAAKRNVVWDATNLRFDYRKQLIDIAQNYHALATLVLFHLSPHIVTTQNQQRTYDVPTAVLQQQWASCQWPTAHEAHRQLIIGERGELLMRLGWWPDSAIT